ncbi:MAG: T9SS type A sorting domain-containing protein [Flavobacteriales bacterium]|nr:T9SS type A sorting domain-containing protein [Flavobacteriales bacterium]
MKKTTLFISATVAGAMAVGISLSGLLNPEAVYTPRVEGRNVLTKSPKSIEEFNKIFRYDQETGKINEDAFYTELNAFMKSNASKAKALGVNWIEMGPSQVGGRTRAILIDKTVQNKIWAGSVSGGLFYSLDNGNTWQSYNNLMVNLSITSICQTANGKIYVGTGTTFEQPDGNTGSGALGAGIFEILGNGNYEQVVGPVPPITSGSDKWTAVNYLAASGNRLFAATKGGLWVCDPDGNGKYPSANWFNPVNIVSGNPLKVNGACTGVEVASDGTVLVAFSGKVYVSPNGNNETFGDPITLSGSRINIAIAPSNPNVMYAAGTTGPGCLAKIYRSENKGVDGSWETIATGGGPFDPYTLSPGPPAAQCQGWYDMAIAVYPNDPDKILVGGIELFKWVKTQSGPVAGQWTQISVWQPESFSNPYYIHADKHNITFKDNNTVFVGSDGGIARSVNGGINWTQNNKGYNVTQFYSVGYTAGPGITNDIVIGGTQDNGTRLIGVNPGASDLDYEVMGGDGFTCDIANVAGIAFGTVYSGDVRRMDNFGSGDNFWNKELETLCETGAACAPFYTTIRHWDTPFDPNTKDSVWFKANKSYTQGEMLNYVSMIGGIPLSYPSPYALSQGDSLKLPDYVQSKFAFNVTKNGSAIYLTRDALTLGKDVPAWFRVANSTNGFSGTAHQMEFSRDGNHLFVCTNNGLYRISNLAVGWDSLTLDNRSNMCVVTCTKIGTSMSGTIAGVAIDPNDANNVVAVIGGYGGTAKVYRSTDALSGGNFTSITGPASSNADGYLPRVAIYDAEIDLSDKNRVLLATDYGVFGSNNAFTSNAANVKWYEENTGMARVPVHEIRQQHYPWQFAYNSGTIYIGTHGRGFFKSTSLVGIKDNDIKADNTGVSQLSVYPNPVSNNGTVSFKLEKNTETSIRIFDIRGQLMKEINSGNLSVGKQNVSFSVSDLPNGTYIMQLKTANETKTTKFVVVK